MPFQRVDFQKPQTAPRPINEIKQSGNSLSITVILEVSSIWSAFEARHKDLLRKDKYRSEAKLINKDKYNKNLEILTAFTTEVIKKLNEVV
jgi:hypothetical protein